MAALSPQGQLGGLDWVGPGLVRGTCTSHPVHHTAAPNAAGVTSYGLHRQPSTDQAVDISERNSFV